MNLLSPNANRSDRWLRRFATFVFVLKPIQAASKRGQGGSARFRTEALCVAIGVLTIKSTSLYKTWTQQLFVLER